MAQALKFGRVADEQTLCCYNLQAAGRIGLACPVYQTNIDLYLMFFGIYPSNPLLQLKKLQTGVRLVYLLVDLWVHIPKEVGE